MFFLLQFQSKENCFSFCSLFEFVLYIHFVSSKFYLLSASIHSNHSRMEMNANADKKRQKWGGNKRKEDEMGPRRVWKKKK